MRAWLFAMALLLASTSASALEARVSAGFDMGWLAAGRTNPTGGVAFMPVGRISVATPWPWLAVTYAQSPILVAIWDDRRGFLDANDVGFEVRPVRTVSLSFAGTAAPAYALWCNRLWCLRECLVAGGGVLSARGHVFQNERGAGLRFDLSARLLYAEPTAWTWPRLPPEERRVLPMVLVAGGAHWSW